MTTLIIWQILAGTFLALALMQCVTLYYYRSTAKKLRTMYDNQTSHYHRAISDLTILRLERFDAAQEFRARLLSVLNDQSMTHDKRIGRANLLLIGSAQGAEAADKDWSRPKQVEKAQPKRVDKTHEQAWQERYDAVAALELALEQTDNREHAMAYAYSIASLSPETHPDAILEKWDAAQSEAPAKPSDR